MLPYDFCYIPICHNHTHHFNASADLAFRSLVGAFVGFSAAATIRGLVVLACIRSGIAGFIEFYNMDSSYFCFVSFTMHGGLYLTLAFFQSR